VGAEQSDWHVRAAVLADAPAIADVHVRSWRAAYEGQLPDAYLGKLSAEERAASWRVRLTAPVAGWGAFVAVSDGQIMGFIAFGPSGHDDAPPGWAEIYALYLERAAWGRGIGRALLDDAERALLSFGFAQLGLWVLESNDRARRFYENAGWVTDRRVTVSVEDDMEFREVVYTKATPLG
jgi:GNAT superfamily N-acetyltransferase